MSHMSVGSSGTGHSLLTHLIQRIWGPFDLQKCAAFPDPNAQSS